MAGPWEQFQSTGQGPWTQFAPVAPPPPEKQSAFRQVADIPLGIAKGAVQGVRMIADAFGAGSDTSKTIKSAETYLADLMSAQAKNDQQEISRIMKDAEDKGVLDQVKAGIKAFTIAPVDTLSSALGTAAPVIAGALGAKILGAGALVSTGVSALTGAGMGAGVVKGSIYEETKNALKEAGASEQDAENRAKLAQEYGGKNLDQILLGTVLGGAAAVGPLEKGAAGILARRILGKTGAEATESVAEQAAKGAVRRRVEAGALEAIPEAVQAGQEQVAQNIALQREGFDVPTFRGAVSSATLEALAGAGLGSALGGGKPEVAPAPAPEAPAPPAPPVGALEFKPEPFIQFPDGTVAKRSEVEAYIKTLPEDQQMAMRAKLLGLAPQEAEKEPAPPAKALEYKPEPLIVYPDGSVAKRSEVDAYIQGLPEDEQIPARAKLLGMGEEATQVTPEMLRKLGIRGRAPIIQRLTGLELTDPKVAEELTNFAQQPFASPEVRGNIFGFLNTIKPIEAPAAPETPAAPPVAPAPVSEAPPAVEPPATPVTPTVETPAPAAETPAPPVEAAAPVVEAAAPTISELRQRVEQADELSEEWQTRIDDLKNAVAQDIKQTLDANEMPVFVSKSGLTSVITPSAQQGGMFQLTRYNQTGAIGDSQYKTIEEAITDNNLQDANRLDKTKAEEHMAKLVDAEAAYQSSKKSAPAAESPAAKPAVEAPAPELTPAEIAQQIKDLKDQQTKLLTKAGKVPAPRSPARQKYDALSAQIADLESKQLTVRSQKPRKRPSTIMGSPMLAGIFNQLGGLHTSLLSEFSTRFITKRIGRKGKPIVQMRNPLVPGYGTLFNKDGKFDFGEIAEYLEQEGYLEPGSLERDYKDAGERAKDLIKQALNREEVLPIQDRIDRDAQEREESERQRTLDRQEENRMIASGELQLEPEFEWTNEDIEKNLGLDREFETDLEMYDLEPKDLEFLSDEELESELTDAEREQAQARRTRKAEEDAARQKAEGAAPGEDEEILTRPTAEGLKAKQEAAEKAAAEEKKAKAAEQERLRKEQQAKEEKARADETVKDFELGKSAEEQMTGMGDLFERKSLGSAKAQRANFEQTLRTLLNKFGLKDVGLNIVEGMDDAGSYSQQLIRIAAEEANPIRTLRHEAIHALRELGFFTDAQWKSLSKMAKDKWIDQYLKQRNVQGRPLKAGEESRYDAYMREYNGDMEKITEEAVADAFADFDATKPPAGMIQALLKRMKDLFQSIKSALTKVESPEQIFGKVEKGKLKPGEKRQAGERKSVSGKRSTQEVARIFGQMVKRAEKELSSALFNWNDSRLNEDKDKIVVYPGRDQRFVRGKEGGKSNVSKAEFIDWLMSDAPFDTSVYGEEITRDAEWKSEIEALRSIVTTPDIRKSLGKATDPGQQALETIRNMGMDVPKPDPTKLEKAKDIWQKAKEDPKLTAQSAMKAARDFMDKVETWAFSPDAKLNNDFRRAVIKDFKENEGVLGQLLEMSQSQAVHADALSSQFLIDGGLKYNDDLKKWESFQSKANFPALSKKLDEIGAKYGLTKEQIERVAHTYLVAKRLPGLIERNKNLDAEIAAEQASIKPDKTKIKNLEDKKVFISDKQLEQIEPGLSLVKNIPELNQVVDMWNEIRKNTIDVMVNSGLWSPEYAQAMWDNMDYVPYFREDQIENEAGPQEFIRGLQVKSKEFQLKGSEDAVHDVFDNMIRWTQYAINRSVRAHKALQMVDNVKDIQIGDRKMAVKVTEEKRGMNIARVFRDGKQELYDMADPMYVQAFSAIQNVSIPTLKFMARVSNVLRQSVVLYPLFSVAQVPQDAFAAMFTSGLKTQHALKIPILAVKEFIKTLNKTSQTHETLKRFGATGVRDFSATVIRDDAEIYAGLKPPRGGWGKTKEFLSHISMAADNAVRQAVYEASMQQGVKQSEAIEKAFDLINFRRKGTSKMLNILGQTVPFFYAYLSAQRVALKVLTGTGISPTDRKEAFQTLATTSAAVATLSLLYAMANADDEDYMETPAAIRDRTLTIPGSGGVRIPLRPDFFLFPKIVAEHTYLMISEQGYQDAAKFRKSMWDALGSAIASPTPFPTAIKPAIEVAINYDFFQGKPLIGTFEKDKALERQFRDSTSEFAKLLGSTGLVSPIAADHMIRGMFGSFGGLFLYGTNQFLHSDPDVPRPELNATEMLAALPGTSGLLKRPQESALKNDFYMLRDEVEKAVNTFNDIKTRSPQGMQDFLDDEKQMARYMLGKPVDKINRELAKIRRQITIITNMPESMMSASEKADFIRELREYEREYLKSVDVKALREMAKI